MARRGHGKAAFLDLKDGTGRIQLHSRADVLGESHEQLLRDPGLPKLPAGMATRTVLMSEHPAAAVIATATAATWAGAEVSFAPVAG